MSCSVRSNGEVHDQHRNRGKLVVNLKKQGVSIEVEGPKEPSFPCRLEIVLPPELSVEGLQVLGPVADDDDLLSAVQGEVRDQRRGRGELVVDL